MVNKIIFQTAITDTATTDKEGVGNIRWIRQSTGMCAYRWVYNNTGGSTVIGSTYLHPTAGYALTTGANPSTFFEEIVTFGQSGKGTSIAQMAGVAMSVIAAASYGWIQVYGYNSAVITENTVNIVVGDWLKPVTAQVYLVHSTAAGTAPTASRGAIAVAAQSGGAGQTTTASIIFCL